MRLVTSFILVSLLLGGIIASAQMSPMPSFSAAPVPTPPFLRADHPFASMSSTPMPTPGAKFTAVPMQGHS